MRVLLVALMALFIYVPTARADISIRIGTSHSEGERYLGGTDKNLGDLSENTEGLLMRGGSHADNNAWSVSVDHYLANPSKAMREEIGLAKETWQEGMNIQLSPYFKFTQGHLSIDGGGDIFTGNAYYLNIYPTTAQFYRNKVVIGMERDTDRSELNVIYASNEIEGKYILAGYSDYSQVFQHASKERTDHRWALAVTIPLNNKRNHYWIFGGGSDGYNTSQLAGISGALGESNDYLVVWRERIRRGSKGEPMATQFAMANLNFEGYGYHMMLPEFFPGLLKTSKIIANKDVSDETTARGPGGLLDLPTFSLTAMMLRIELTKTSELIVNSLQAYYKFAERMNGIAKPHIGFAFNEQSDIFFDYDKYELSDSVSRSADFILGGGIDLWTIPLEMQMTARYDLSRSKPGRIQFALSTTF